MTAELPDSLAPEIRRWAGSTRRKLVVLDDDPTGTQTVHDVPVLTEWTVAALEAEFAHDLPCFYVLTNSRSLPPKAAYELNREIARNLLQAAGARASADTPFPRPPSRGNRDFGPARFALVSRSDSTLRGHFPLEPEALAEVLGPFDATFLFPYFAAGGRYTINDVHYVAEAGGLVPAAETPFARDAVFGYRSSNLREWVEEKTGGTIKAAAVASIGLDELRSTPPGSEPGRALAARMLGLPRGSLCVVNAEHPRDAQVFALATLLAEREGGRFLYRTAAEFVGARLGLEGRLVEVPAPSALEGARHGGLIVAGSHVPRTTEQLEHLWLAAEITPVELDVHRILSGEGEAVLRTVTGQVNQLLARGRDVAVWTSRTVVTGLDPSGSLDIGKRISEALVRIVQRLEVRPRVLLAKGGITSSDLATRGLGVRRAMVRGQILPGVPVWELGGETRFPGLNYVVFPGNVGGPAALAEVWARCGGSVGEPMCRDSKSSP